MVMINNLSLSFIMLLSGVIFYVLNRKHLLSTLLSLEFIVLSMFYLLFMTYLNMSQYVALGLSIMVMMIRTQSNDYFQLFNILVC